MSEKEQSIIDEAVNHYVMEQNSKHYDTLKIMSHCGLVLLNTLGDKVYKLEGGFN